MRNIVVVDSGLTGHRLSFNRTFSKILLKLGCRVFLLVPGSPSLIPWIMEEAAEQSQNFFAIDYLYNNNVPKRPGRIAALQSQMKHWRAIGKQVQHIEIKYNLDIDLVFFSWIDDFLGQYIHPWILEKIFPWKWTGLYFHPYHLRRESRFTNRTLNWRDIDSPFLSNQCIGVCIHDRSIANSLELKRYHKRVYIFPETADCSKPDETNELAKQIKSLAKERVVVGLIGCEPHKGVEMALDLASSTDPTKYFFVFLGSLNLMSFSNELLVKWQNFFDTERENCFSCFGHIDEGPSYNALFAAIDIHFLVYVDFVSSSNRLTKAAALSRYVLAADQYCVGDDVKAFNLGEVVPPGDLELAIESLDRLRGKILNDDFPLSQWITYAKLNSEDELSREFSSLIASLDIYKNFSHWVGGTGK